MLFRTDLGGLMAYDFDSAAAEFLTMAQRIPRLTREDEANLARRWRDERDRRAADTLVRAHLRDVAFVAYKHRHYGVPVSELVAEGNLGLLRALEKFDPDLGNRFATYAAYWIRAYVVSSVLRSWSMVRNRSGVVRTKVFFRLRRERARAISILGEDGDVAALVAERLGITREAVVEMTGRLDARDVSLDDSPRGDGGGMLDTLAAPDDTEAVVAGREAREKIGAVLEEALATLDPRERFIVEQRILADDEDELSLAEIGRKFGVSRERVRQLEERARKKLRQSAVARYGEEFVAA
jgi:RNA polymerase sigma-32 factor